VIERVLVTGANGFLAGHLISRLRSECRVTLLATDLHQSIRNGVRVDSYEPCDLRTPGAAESVVRRAEPELVYHLAGLNKGTPCDFFAVNVLGTVALLEAVRQVAPRARVLLVGSAAEYGLIDPANLPVGEEHPCRPVGPYGISKYAMTVVGQGYARGYGLHVVCARLFNLVGARISPDMMVGAFLARAAKELAAPTGSAVVEMGRLDAWRDYLAVEDAAEGCIGLLESAGPGEVVNLCSGAAVETRTVIEKLCSFSPRPMQVRVDPKLASAQEVKTMYGDSSKARKLFGFKPRVSLEEALRSAWDFAFSGAASPARQAVDGGTRPGGA